MSNVVLDKDVTPAAKNAGTAVPSAKASKAALSGKSLLLYEAFNEYEERIENGEDLDPDVFCAEHPHLQSKLAKLLQLNSFLEKNDELTATILYPEVGASFLHFTLLHELGEGAFAKVFLAEDSALGRRAALKLSRRAKAEARLMGPIEHPNIALVHSVAEDKESGLTAICMPYRGSATLENVLNEIQDQPMMPSSARIILDVAQDLPLPLDSGSGQTTPNPILQHGTYVDGVRALGAQVAGALAYLHEHEICHRDLKPSNILITPNGTPMLLDFNLSSDEQAESMPFGGTLPYMAPEVLTGLTSKQKTSPTVEEGSKADIYSFGVILYELVTGKHPLGTYSLKLTTRELRDHLLARQRNGVLPACDVNPQVDRRFSDLIQRCLALNPLDRPVTAAAIAAELRPTLPAEPTPKPVSRRRTLAFAGVLLFGMLLVAAALIVVFRPITPENHLRAAEASYKQADFSQSIFHCASVLSADPKSERALYLSARSKSKIGMTGNRAFFDSALTEFEILQSKYPHARNLAAMGFCCNGLNRNDPALASYLKALELKFENAEIHNNIGYCLMKNGSLPEAVQSLDVAIRMKPDLALPYYNRALIAVNTVLLKRANAQGVAVAGQANQSVLNGIGDIQKAIKLGEDSANIYFDAARLCAIAAEADRTYAPQGITYLKLSLKRGLKLASLDDPILTSIRNEIDAEKLHAFVSPSHPNVVSVRYLDPVLD